MTTTARSLPGLVLALALGAAGVSAPALAGEPPPAADAAGPGATGSMAESAAAGEAVLVVRVVDGVTGEAVPWANVIAASGGFLAGADGVCRIPGRATLAGPLRVEHVAYHAAADIDCSTAGPSGVVVRLMPRAHAIDPVRVSAAAPGRALADAAGGRSVVQVESAAALPNPADDPFLLIRLLPGVAAEDVGSGFRLHGGGVDETLVRLDGMEVRSLFHGRDFGGVTGIIPMGMVDRLDVYAGAFPARLGGRTSGAVDVGLRDRGTPGFHGTVAADVTAARALLESHGPRGSAFLSVREGYLHHVLDRLQDDAFVEPAYRDLLVRGVRRIGDAGTLTGNFLRVEDHVFYDDGIRSHALDGDYLDQYAWAGLQWLVAPDLAVRGTAFGVLSDQRRHVEESRRDDRDSRRAGARAEATFARGSHLWTAGAEAESEWSDTRLRGGTVVRIAPDGTLSTSRSLDEHIAGRTDRRAAWVQDEWSPVAGLSLNAGLRVSHDTVTDETRPCPRLGAAWRLPSRWTAHAAWGRHAQPPRGGLEGDDDVLVLSERTQRSDHMVFGLEHGMGTWTFGAEAWRKGFRPLDGVVTRTVDDLVESHVIRSGDSRGLDLSLRRDRAGSHAWVAYSLGRSEWCDGARTYSRDFDALHTLAVANTMRLSSHWEVGFSYRFRTGTPYTEQSWSHANRGDWVLTEGPPYSARLPDYHRVDVRVRRYFSFHGWRGSVWGEALNLTNHDNVLWYGWRLLEPDGTSRTAAERVTRTGVPGIPSVGLQLDF